MKRMKINLFLLLALCLGACTEESFEYTDRTDLAMFSLTSETFLAVDGIDNVKEFTVASPVISEVDRAYMVKIEEKGTDEEAEENEVYEMVSGIVTIPAGEYTGTFRVRAFPQAMNEGEEQLAYLTLVAVEKEHPVAAFNNTMTIAFGRTCVFAAEDMPGTFDIYTRLLNLGTYDNKIAKVPVVADPDAANGFIVKSPYAEGVDLKMKMWPTDQGYWEVEMEDVFLTHIVPDDPRRQPYDVYGYGRGVWYPCMHGMVINYYLHLEDNDELIGVVTEQFDKLN